MLDAEPARTYFFADWAGKVWTANHTGNTLTGITSRQTELLPTGATSLGTTVDFGEDQYGELYWVSWATSTGAVYKIEPRTLNGPDCNGNGKPDDCDIAKGVSLDVNHNGVPDECDPPQCVADFNHDTMVDPDDLGDYINCYFSNPPCAQAEINADGSVNPDDLGDFINLYFLGC